MSRRCSVGILPTMCTRVGNKHTLIHTYIGVAYLRAHTPTYLSASYLYLLTHPPTHLPSDLCIHTCIITYIRSCIRTYTYMPRDVRPCIHTFIHSYIHTDFLTHLYFYDSIPLKYIMAHHPQVFVRSLKTSLALILCCSNCSRHRHRLKHVSSCTSVVHCSCHRAHGYGELWF